MVTLAGVGMGCYNIAQTQSRQEKNEIFVETLVGTTTSIVSGIGLTLLFASNPAGWVLALSLGISAAYGSYRAGKEAVKYYNKYGQEIDIVSYSGIETLCK